MNKKTIALIIILIILVGFTAYVFYSEFKPVKINPIAEIKNYIALYFLSSRASLPLNPDVNSTEQNG